MEQSMKQRLHRFDQTLREQGRNGFGRFLLGSALAMLLLAWVVRSLWFLALFAVFPLIWAPIRAFSKKLEQREIEQEAYLALVERYKSDILLSKRRWADRRTHIYFRCRDCNTVLRLPRGKGRVKTVCPGCGEEIIRKT